jgi:ipoprotein LpqH
MTMNRVVAGALALAAGGALLVGCSDKSSPQASVSTNAKTQVKVDGNDLSGFDLNSVTCAKQGGKITVGSGNVGTQQGLAILMTDANPPAVEQVSIVVDGNALAVSNMGGMKTGNAEAKVDGSTYTVTGEATGADMKNPMAGMITKPFSVTVSCK